MKPCIYEWPAFQLLGMMKHYFPKTIVKGKLDRQIKTKRFHKGKKNYKKEYILEDNEMPRKCSSDAGMEKFNK